MNVLKYPNFESVNQEGCSIFIFTKLIEMCASSAVNNSTLATTPTPERCFVIFSFVFRMFHLRAFQYTWSWVRQAGERRAKWPFQVWPSSANKCTFALGNSAFSKQQQKNCFFSFANCIAAGLTAQLQK